MALRGAKQIRQTPYKIGFKRSGLACEFSRAKRSVLIIISLIFAFYSHASAQTPDAASIQILRIPNVTGFNYRVAMQRIPGAFRAGFIPQRVASDRPAGEVVAHAPAPYIPFWGVREIKLPVSMGPQNPGVQVSLTAKPYEC